MKKIRGAKERQPIYSGLHGAIAKAVDKTVGLFAPGVAHEMRRARVRSEALLAFEAAEITRTSPKKRTHSGDSALLPNLQELRNVCRDLVRNDAHAGRAVKILQEMIVGEGIVPRASVQPDDVGATQEVVDEWNKQCNREWKRWAKNEELADARQRLTFYGLQSQALRARVVDGEFLAHAAMRDGHLCCELIDADRLISPGDRDTERMRGGVELDQFGAAIAYHILPTHPADAVFGSPFSINPTRTVKRDGLLSVIQHGFTADSVGANRGIPKLVAGAEYLRHLHHYLSSELIAARAASNYALFIRRDVAGTDTDLLPVAATESDTGKMEEYHTELEAGVIEYLNEGEEPVPFTPNRPGAQFDTFVTRMLRAIAGATNLSYEQVCLDYGRMNLSSARAMLRDIQRGTDLERVLFVGEFCDPWWRNVIVNGIQQGRLTPPPGFLDDPRSWLAARWVAPGYGMVDPISDVEGSRKACDANLSTPWDEAQRWGVDAEHVLRERARFFVLARKLETDNGLEPGQLTKESPERIESSSRQVDPSAGQNQGDSESATPQPPASSDEDPEDPEEQSDADAE